MEIKCPYFVKTARHNVCCEGIGERIKQSMSRFENLEERNKFIQDFCACECWQGCPVALAIEENMYLDS